MLLPIIKGIRVTYPLLGLPTGSFQVWGCSDNLTLRITLLQVPPDSVLNSAIEVGVGCEAARGSKEEEDALLSFW